MAVPSSLVRRGRWIYEIMGGKLIRQLRRTTVRDGHKRTRLTGVAAIKVRISALLELLQDEYRESDIWDVPNAEPYPGSKNAIKCHEDKYWTSWAG